MIMKTTEFTQYLKDLFPLADFYTGMINKSNPKCVGVYAKGRAGSELAIGGVVNTSSNILPISLLIHWTESTTLCETMANDIYDALLGQYDFTIAGRRVISVKLLDSCPVDVSRDAGNIVEMVIRANIIYEREVI